MAQGLLSFYDAPNFDDYPTGSNSNSNYNMPGSYIDNELIAAAANADRPSNKRKALDNNGGKRKAEKLSTNSKKPNQTSTGQQNSRTEQNIASSHTESYKASKIDLDACADNVEKCKTLLESITSLSGSIDIPLRQHTDACTKEINYVAEHYKGILKKNYCYMCQKSPKTNPQRARAVECGHLFSCLECFVTYFNSAQGNFYCPRCNTPSSVTLQLN